MFHAKHLIDRNWLNPGLFHLFKLIFELRDVAIFAITLFVIKDDVGNKNTATMSFAIHHFDLPPLFNKKNQKLA
ncbi:hypothetical protein A2833_03330 [Candidatus Azambacteria bacterium RIFCSPHIGHO2_01_FULL_44_55]|uniref:Uncharacterized protein n=1 Tax=Candidatus Azambacteria bacterium RIFCSPLOWO2_02_FULL_44_14 TaxID=1797306 RepID=A0A1F5CAM0_9BACT|nr:MAG: hypothetical protein A3C78_00480 [Candidatus Azambacteria bacterium RIFCSPHIGHO2_02_FULL_45_18]OGD39913.1 MAG: hypothetical protein A3I30_01560 [Candidatus Azambacteria bacterium RIFCSPLOWO2_02_FULL_44_14]OGD40803.1 MAG: hypothetical protein A2833_03330 [Candidatus Azambacteria bacterium RIFCSPHIGHO2_01_FULL_44_55]